MPTARANARGEARRSSWSACARFATKTLTRIAASDETAQRPHLQMRVDLRAWAGKPAQPGFQVADPANEVVMDAGVGVRVFHGDDVRHQLTSKCSLVDESPFLQHHRV